MIESDFSSSIVVWLPTFRGGYDYEYGAPLDNYIIVLLWMESDCDYDLVSGPTFGTRLKNKMSFLAFRVLFSSIGSSCNDR